MASEAHVSHEKYIDTMSRVGNSVSIVTSNGVAGMVGITVSAVTSVTADPPSLLICINNQSQSVNVIKKNGKFCVNYLNSNQKDISNLFAGLVDGESSDPFSKHSWTESNTGSLVLSDSLAVFDCNISSHIIEGSHTIFIGRVYDVYKREGEPLIYAQRAYAKPVWV